MAFTDQAHQELADVGLTDLVRALRTTSGVLATLVRVASADGRLANIGGTAVFDAQLTLVQVAELLLTIQQELDQAAPLAGFHLRLLNGTDLT